MIKIFVYVFQNVASEKDTRIPFLKLSLLKVKHFGGVSDFSYSGFQIPIFFVWKFEKILSVFRIKCINTTLNSLRNFNIENFKLS